MAPKTYKTLTPYRNRERKVDFVWEVQPVTSVKPAPATLTVLTRRETKVVERVVPCSEFGDLGLKRRAA